MSNPRAKQILAWVDQRFALTALYNRQLNEYYAAKNLSFWYISGALALTVLAIQVASGILLAMHYKPDAARDFASVEYIMRDKALYAALAAVFLVLGYLRTLPPTPAGTVTAQALTLGYFAFFLAMPAWSRRGTSATPPCRVRSAPH